MSDTAPLDRTDRNSALDAFARAGEIPAPSSAVTIPSAAFSAPAERVFGAQAVAVHRDETKVLQKLKALAAAAGTDWYYRYPVKNRSKGTTDWIEGASIKLANDLARMYGNCEVETRVMDLGDSWLIYARFTDYETGFALTRPFQQRKSAGKIGGDDDARRLDIAFQIGVSKAIRNVVTNALQTFSDFAFEEAKNALVDKIGKNLPDYRQRVSERLAARLDIKRVEAVVGRTVAEWLAPDIARVIAMMKAVDDGMASLDESFPRLAADQADQAKPDPGQNLREFAAGAPAKETGVEASSAAPQDTGAASAASAAPASETSGDPQEDEAEDASPKATLLDRLRGAAMRGARPLKRALDVLSDADRVLLTDEDRKALTDAAAHVDATSKEG